MCPFLRSAAALAVLWAAAAAAQDLGVVAELPGAFDPYSPHVFVQPLARNGPTFLVNVAAPLVSVWPLGGAPEPVMSTLPADARPYVAPAFADFDGDGLLDLAVATASGISFLKGDGAGRFVEAGTLPTQAPPYALAAGDFDGDGRVDIVVYLPQGSETVPEHDLLLSAYLSKGGLRFDAPRTTVVTPCCGINTITAGDLDGDGRADVVVSAFQGAVSVWRSAGDGTFVLSQSISTFYPSQAILGDLDGDGLPELVFRVSYRFPPFYVVAYKNEGGGRFHLLASLGTSPYASSPFVVDVDGDGRPEILFKEQTETGKSYVSILKLVDGAFIESRLALPNTRMVIVAAADWDGDGRPEFVGVSTDRLQIFARSGARTDVAVVPVLLATTGLLGSRFDSDLLLTNSGSTPAHVTLWYTAAAGGGSGTVEHDLAPGRQLFAPSAVGFLRDAGLPIATDGNVIGTLRIEVTGASSPGAVSAAVRTTTPAGAGVAYGGMALVSLLRGPSVVSWLVETAKDRTNLALVNAGSAADGSVTLRVEVHAGDLSAAPVVLPDVVLSPGAFSQIGRVLAAAGLTAPRGWARIVRVAGNAPYLAWAAVNDAGSSDGSFVPAMPESAAFNTEWVVPSAVQTVRYATEFVATNPGVDPVTLQVTLVTTGTVLQETLGPGATFYVLDFFAELRRRGLPGAPAAGAAVVSPLYLRASGFPQVFAGIRVSSGVYGGSSYGVFEPAMPQGPLDAFSAVVPDLRQDGQTRTNLGILNLVSGPMTFRVDIVDGETGSLVTSRDDLVLAGNELRQLNSVLLDLGPGTKRAWARVTPLSPYTSHAPFAAYAVVNDGPVPGQGTDDGSFVSGIPE